MEINDISKFLEKEKEKYIKKKIKEYRSKGFSRSEAVNKANQSWRSHIGARIQDVVLQLLDKDLRGTRLKLTTDKILVGRDLSKELDLVKRKLVINYGKYLFLPDADIVIYKSCHDDDVRIIAIISVKNSFRERGFETTYWKLKLSESPITSNIKVFLATPDKDNEISYISPNGKPIKMRIILEYELDGIYFLKRNFEKTTKAKHFKEIIADIKELADSEC